MYWCILIEDGTKNDFTLNETDAASHTYVIVHDRFWSPQASAEVEQEKCSGDQGQIDKTGSGEKKIK